MEVSTEISQKIRSAIKAKLMELGAYVDDELPDYIMVMVANKKSRSQMSSDLCLFLGTNTDAFTGWLHGLLGKLQTITVESSEKLKTKTTKERKKDKKESKDKKKSKRHSSETSSKKKPETLDKNESSQGQLKHLSVDESPVETNLNLDKDINLTSKPDNESDANQQPHKNGEEFDLDLDLALDSPKLTANQPNVQEDVEDVRQLLVTGAQADELAEELETTEEEVKKSISEGSKTVKSVESNKTSAKVISAPTASRSRSPSPDKPSDHVPVVNRKRKIPISSVVAHVSKKSDNDEEEYDPYNPAVGSVASVVKVTSRRSSVPASLQANREMDIKNCAAVEGQPPLKMLKVSEPISLGDIKHVLEDVIKSSQEKNDDICLFSKMVDSSLRKLKAHQLPLAKLKIQQVLYEFENLSHQVEAVQVNDTLTDKFENLSYQVEAVQVNDTLTDKPNTLDTPEQINSDVTLCSTSNQGQTLTNNTSKSLDQFHIKNINDKYVYSLSKLDKRNSSTKLAKAKVPTDTSHVNHMKTLPRDSERGFAEDAVPQSPVSSSKMESGSPCSVHSCPPSSTSGSDSLALRRCIVSTSTQSPLSLRGSKLTESKPLAGTSNYTDQSIASVIVDSIHKKSRTEPTEPVSVLRQCGTRTKALHGTGPPDYEEEPARINPEALKVLAKNLKVTVINKRAAQKLDQSSSEESSSEGSDDEESSDEEEVNQCTIQEETNRLDNKDKIDLDKK